MRTLITGLAVASAISAVVPTETTPTPLIASVTVVEEVWMPIVQPEHWAIMTIIGEAASEPLEGQVAVGSVIRNRMEKEYSSDGTVIGTVLRAKQFSMWDDRARIYAAKCEIESPVYVAAAEAWYLSKFDRPVDDAVLYHTINVDPSWNRASSVEKVRRIGAHIFYRDTGRGI